LSCVGADRQAGMISVCVQCINDWYRWLSIQVIQNVSKKWKQKWMKKLTCRRRKLTALPLRVAVQRFFTEHCRVREFDVPFRIGRCEHVFTVRRFGTDSEGSISVDNAVTMCFRESWTLHWRGKSHLVAMVYKDDKQNQSSWVVGQVTSQLQLWVKKNYTATTGTALQCMHTAVSYLCQESITGQATPDRKTKYCEE